MNPGAAGELREEAPLAGASIGKENHMFTSIDKALAAALMAAIFMLNHFGGIDLGVGEEMITAIVAALTPVLVYLVPNKKQAR